MDLLSGRYTAPWQLPGAEQPLEPLGHTFALPEQRPVYSVRQGRVARAVMPRVQGAGIDAIVAQLSSD